MEYIMYIMFHMQSTYDEWGEHVHHIWCMSGEFATAMSSQVSDL